jgi:hypothetical protein
MGRRKKALDEIESAHRSVGGTGRGRRFATQQINHAYAVLLSSQFQGFCRDLHDECVTHLVQSIASPRLQTALGASPVLDRKLNRGNANPHNIGQDYNRLGLLFWKELQKADPRTSSRRNHLEDLNKWRNAIAHQDFNSSILGIATLQLRRVRGWRNACDGLSRGFDQLMRSHILAVAGTSPW